MVLSSATKVERTGRHQADAATAKAFSQIVVRFSFQAEMNAVGEEGTETLVRLSL